MSLPKPQFVYAGGGDVPTQIASLQVSWDTSLQKGFTAAKPQWQMLAKEVPITAGGKMVLAVVDRTFDFSLWTGALIINDVVVREADITANPQQLAVAIDKYKFQDDVIGVYPGLFEDIGCQIRILPDKLLGTAILTGTSTPWYDGAYFYDDEHPVNPENPTEFGTQSNNLVNLPLSPVNYALARATLMSTLAANGRKFGTNPNRIATGTQLEILARTIVQADVIPTSIQNLDGSTYGAAATTNLLRGTAEQVTLNELDSAPQDYYLMDMNLSSKAPFAIGQRDPIKMIPRVADTDPIVSEQHKYLWIAEGRVDCSPVLYQATLRATGAGS